MAKRLFKINANPVIYALEVSGHGSRLKRDGALMTKDDALEQAKDWESFADTIGGTSRVTNIFTGQVVYHYGQEFPESTT